jgi:hypothetical protein
MLHQCAILCNNLLQIIFNCTKLHHGNQSVEVAATQENIMKEVEIKTKQGVKVHISEWNDGGAWLRMGLHNGSVYAALTREEAEQMLKGLQTILAKEVVA